MTYLGWLKEHKKSLVIIGPTRCGKTLLAKQIAGPRSHRIFAEQLLVSAFTPWPYGIETVIVEGVLPLEKMGEFAVLVKSDRMTHSAMMKSDCLDDVPTFIFIGSSFDSMKYLENDPSFVVMTLNRGELNA